MIDGVRLPHDHVMASDIRMALDPAAIGERVGLALDDWQADLIRSRPKRALLCCSRQSGKTTAALLSALWTALYEAPALVLIVSPSQRQSGEAFRSFTELYHRLDAAPELKAESLTRAELANGSRVVSLPGSERTIRGFSGAKLIVLDEAARIEDPLIAALRPMMATVKGSMIALSTPAGKRGFFYEAWTGSDDWHRVSVPASQCPRLDPETLVEELRELGPLRYSEEYELAFLEPEESVFPTAIIDRAFTNEVTPLWQ
jgi:hypothetical protein